MTGLDRAIWICGLVGIIATVVYWPTIKAAYKNRQTIAAVADVAAAWDGLTKGEVRS